MANSSKTEKTAKPNFFRGVKKEFKKITWPDKNEVFKQTISVTIISVFTGIIIKLLDIAIIYGVELLTTF